MSLAADAAIVPRCAHYSECRGCVSQHVSRAAQLATKQQAVLDDLERLSRVRSREILAQLGPRLPPSIVHVSCHPATLALLGKAP